MVWIWSLGGVKMCSALSDCLNYNMLNDYYWLFAQWHQRKTAYPSFNPSIVPVILCTITGGEPVSTHASDIHQSITSWHIHIHTYMHTYIHTYTSTNMSWICVLWTMPGNWSKPTQTQGGAQRSPPSVSGAVFPNTITAATNDLVLSNWFSNLFAFSEKVPTSLWRCNCLPHCRHIGVWHYVMAASMQEGCYLWISNDHNHVC